MGAVWRNDDHKADAIGAAGLNAGHFCIACVAAVRRDTKLHSHLMVFVLVPGEAAGGKPCCAGQLQSLAVCAADVAVGAAADHAVLHKLHKAPPLSP